MFTSSIYGSTLLALHLIFLLNVPGVFAATANTNSGLCGLIAATNIGAVYSEWACSSTGAVATDPCDPVWSGLTCTSGEPVQLSVTSRKLAGTLPVALGSMTQLVGFSFVAAGKLTGECWPLRWLVLIVPLLTVRAGPGVVL